MSEFKHSFNYDLDTLTQGQPQQRGSFLRANQFENDIYKFEITQIQNISLSLNNLESGDDADLYLYADSNNNGILDTEDFNLSSSIVSGNADASINARGESGTYFVYGTQKNKMSQYRSV